MSHSSIKTKYKVKAPRLIVQALKSPGTRGIVLKCADGCERLCYTILSAITIDYEEAVLVTGITNWACPICLVPLKERGNLSCRQWKKRTHEFTRKLIKRQRREGRNTVWVHDVQNFAWSHDHVNIHAIITPDILHQLKKGLLMHLNTWVCELIGKIRPLKVKKGSEREMHQSSGAIQLEHRFQLVPEFPGLHIFKNFSTVKQWTGNEQKAMVQQYVAVLAPLLTKKQPVAMFCVKAIADFITVAQYRVQDDSTLAFMDSAIDRIDVSKIAFAESRTIDKKTQEHHFNIPKLHSITHYTELIRLYGATDGVDTSHSEAAHKYNIKENYSLTNKRNEFLDQMALLNVRRVKILSMEALLAQVQRNSHQVVSPNELSKDYTTTPSKSVPLKKLGFLPTQEELEYSRLHGLAKGYWCKASSAEQHLNIHRLIDALAIFVRKQRNNCTNGLWSLSKDQEPNSLWAENLYISIHPSLTCWKRSGKNSSNLNEMIKEKVRCTPKWQGKQEWRSDYVWVISKGEEAEDPPLSGRIAGQVKITVTVFDPWYPWIKSKSSIQSAKSLFHCGALVEVLRPVNSGIPNPIHGMIEFENWGQSFITNRNLNPRSLQFHSMSTVIRSAHVVPSGKAGLFYINNFIDWDQYNTLYDLESSENGRMTVLRRAEPIASLHKENAALRLKKKEEMQRKRQRKLARLKQRSQGRIGTRSL